MVGLGTGSLACYAQPGQDWIFYEIDPLVERIARDPRYFQFLANCGNRPRVVLGDARLTLAAVPDGTYDVLVADAFSSDSIPMHLLTREALALYLRKLAPGGSLLFHISSRTLDLRSVIGALAADAGCTGAGNVRPAAAGHLALAARSRPGCGVSGAWRRPQPVEAGGRLGGAASAFGARSLWTDQRSDLLRAIRLGF